MSEDVEYLLAELERSLFDLTHMKSKNKIAENQIKAHIRNTRGKLAAMQAGRRAYQIERKYKPWKSQKSN